MKEMKTKLFKKRVPMLFSAMLTLFALLTVTLQAAVMPPLLYRSGENNTLYGKYYYGNYTKGEPTRNYCTPSYSSNSGSDGDCIKGFSLTGGTSAISNLDNGFGTNGYQDFTSYEAVAEAEATLSFTIVPGKDTESLGYAIWVDWNNDEDFTDSGETVANANASAGTKTGTFTVPSTVSDGNYRMRVAVRYNTNPTDSNYGPCESTGYGYGEAEDYTLTISSVTGYGVTAATTITNGSLTFSTDGTTFTSSLSGLNGSETIYVKATADAGYELASMTASGITFSGTGDTRTFTMPTSNVTVSATFSQVSYNVTKGTVTGGDISFSASTAHYGDVITITPVADGCYETPTYTVTDGDNNTITVTNDKFTMPASDVTVSAVFAIQKFNVNLSVCSNADLYITGGNVTNHLVNDALYACEVSCGSSVTLTLSNIQSGYNFIGWRVNGTIVSSDNPWTFTATETVSPTPVFGQVYTVTCATGLDNGSILCSNNNTTMTVGEGVNVTITATPATGYELATMTYNDGTTNHNITVTGNSGTFTMPAANVTVTATFAKSCDSYYYLVEEDLDDWTGEYLIVYTTGNKAFNGGLTGVTGSAVNVGLDVAENNISVSISDKMITRDATTSAACFNIAKYGDYYTIQSASGYFIGKGSTTSGAGMSQATSRSNTYFDHAITYNNGNVDIVSWQGNENGGHIRYNKTSGQARFRYYPKSNSQEPIQLYRKGVMKPVIDPADGSIFMSGMQPVTITAPDGVSTIYYTTDGTEPTTNSTQYTSSFTINTTTTVKAIAVNECGETSFVATALIRSADDDIIMNPLSGTYLAGTEVTIMSPGAFHYTTDGTQPTTSHGTAVSSNSATIILDSTMTIWAVLDSDDTKNAKQYYVVPTGVYPDTVANPAGIVMNKSVSGDFTQSPYTGNITLESYVTGNVTVVEGDPEPVDVVLVLDFSNSMQGTGNTLDDGTEKIVALKNAVDGFLTQLQTSSASHPETPNRVAFVLYGSNHSNVNIPYASHMFYLNGSSLVNVEENGLYDYSDNPYNTTNCNAAFFSFGDETYTPEWAWNTIKTTQTGDGTPTAHGVHAAERIFYYDTDTERKRILVTFTDGAPGSTLWSASSCDKPSDSDGIGAAIANSCLELAHTMKNASSPVTAFSIGIFKGASSNETLPEYSVEAYYEGEQGYSNNANRFMSLLSSNADEQSLCGESSWSNKGYYLTASTSDGLANAFAGIAHAAGGASADLTSNTIVQDVMTGQFRIPEGTTAGQITVQTAECTGYNAPDTTWAAPVTLANPGIQISEDGKTIIVTGFDYSSNWVGYDADGNNWHGKKLIITIPITLEATSDDDVFHGTFATNASGSGIYDADGMPVGNFPTPTTNVDHGKVTWVQKVTTQPSGFNAMEINTANELAWFISLVNGMNGQTAQPGLNGKLTGDIDMSANIWVPIGYNSAHKYTGTFDGNGHTVSGIIIPSESAADYVSWRFDTGKGSGTDNTIGNDSASYYAMGTKLVNEGFFGYTHGATINNLFLTGGTLVTDTIKNVTLGGLVGRAVSTTITFTESAINLVDNGTNDTIGGLIGSSRGTSAKAVMVMGDINANGKAANTLGAIVGYDQLGTIVATFFTNHTISNDDNVVAKNKIGSNGYVRVANEGYDNVIFTPDLFSETKPYEYGNYSTNNTIGTTPLVDLLNQGLGDDEEGVYKWIRPAGANINGDYPIIVKAENDGFAIVNDDEDGKVVRYGEINGLIAMAKYQSTDHSIFMYNNDELTNAPVNTKLYIDEHVALTQSASCNPVNAYVGVTFDNSSMHSSKADTDPTRDWHGFASTIEKGQIGINYGTQIPGYGELGAGAYSFIHNDTVYLPNGVTGPAVDIYAFYEPQYHWINLKRAGNNHWKQDSTSVQIHYNGGGSTDSNETTYTPGKGYFVALGDAEHDNNFMQAYGTLNNSEAGFTVPITNTGAHLQGYNLLGNPFQSYLDFNEFAEVNKNIWAGTSSMGYYSYLIYDADKGGFREYLTDGSQSFSQNAAQDAPRYINMHQAFFVVKDGTLLDAVTFKNSMRRTDTTGMGSITFRDAQPAYPLVNLFCTDSEGKQEISVIELNRPKMAGSLKMKGMLNAKGNMYIHWGSEDFGSMFIDHMPDYVPVWFDAAEDGVFTMSWNTQNAAFGYMHLIDNMTGADIDCLEADSYTFESRVTDMSARFRLVFKPLGIEEETAEQGENFAFFNGSELVVNGEGELSLIDLNGRVLTTQYVSGQQSYVTLPNVAMGMYMLRLTRANDVKVQKIVIRK